MSLENELKKLCEALEANTAALLSASKGTAKPKATKVAPGEAETATPKTVPAVPAAPAPPAAPATVPTAPAAPPAPPVSAPVAPAAPVVMDPQAVNAVLQTKAQQMGDGGAAIFAVLKEKFEVQNVSNLDPSRYGELVEAVKALGA